MKVDNDGLTYSANPGILTNVLVFPDNTKTRQTVPYEFSFVTKNVLQQEGHIAIIVPKDIAVEPSKLQLQPLSTISFSNQVTLRFDDHDGFGPRELIISNAFDESFDPPVQI